jgi:hypothetical protein
VPLGSLSTVMFAATRGFGTMVPYVAVQNIGLPVLRLVLVVAVVALGANLVILRVLVALALDKVLAQAIAIVLVTPVNFIGNKLWSFRR